MKKYLIILSLLVTAFLLNAQSVSNIRVEQDPELRYYKITFDLSGQDHEQYSIKVAPYKEGKEPTQLSFLSGQGIEKPCNPGKDLKVFWAPDLEGYETDGWEFRISVKEITINMVFVEGGTFRMGSNDGESDEKPVHRVKVSSFYIRKHEITVEEFSAFVDATGYRTNAERGDGAYIWTGSKWEKKCDANWFNPYFPQSEVHPVTCVSWYDAVAYCNWRSQSEGLVPVYSIGGDSTPADWSKGTVSCDWDADGYRLPTEAEWEFASRGGDKSKDYIYSRSNDLGYVGWYDGNSGNKTHPVGMKRPNKLGLYDMSGNVWEWCWDWYDEDYYGRSPGSDPKGAGPGKYRLLRGGSWSNYDYNCRVTSRDNFSPGDRYNNSGFRVSRAK